jgi:hypothetical protein
MAGTGSCLDERSLMRARLLVVARYFVSVQGAISKGTVLVLFTLRIMVFVEHAREAAHPVLSLLYRSIAQVHLELEHYRQQVSR